MPDSQLQLSSTTTTTTTLPLSEEPEPSVLKLASLVKPPQRERASSSPTSSSSSSVLSRRPAADLYLPAPLDLVDGKPPTIAETRLKRAASTSKTAQDIEKLYLRLQAVIATVQEPVRENKTNETLSIPDLSSLSTRDSQPTPAEGYQEPTTPTSTSALPPPIPQRSSRRPRASSTSVTEAGGTDTPDVLQQNEPSSTQNDTSPSCSSSITVETGLPEISQILDDEEGKQKDPETEQLRQRIYQLEQELHSRTSQVSSLQSDLYALNAKYILSINRLEEVQHSKDTIEEELEDLSRQLFETANGMVADEARQRHLLEKAQRVLTAKLQETEETLSNEKSQLKELKVKMETMTLMQPFETQSQSELRHQSGEFRRRRLSDYSELNKRPAPRTLGHKSVPNSPIKTDGEYPGASTILSPDDVLTQEFSSFVSQCADTPLKKLNSLPFLRHCLEEDIDSCLRFAPAARIGARRFVDAILNNTLSVSQGYDPTDSGLPNKDDRVSHVPTSPQPRISASKQSLLWERFTQGTPLEPGACHACGRLGPCMFRYRLTDQEPWQPLDGFCRDRLVTVCEFYIFIRNLRLGFYSSRSTEELYSEITRMRLQMFYARIGALSWMDFDRHVLLKAEWVDMSSESISPTDSSENQSSPAFHVSTPLSTTSNTQVHFLEEAAGPALDDVKPSPPFIEESPFPTSIPLKITH